MSRNLVRVVLLIWIAVSLRAGFTHWTDHGVPVVARAETTATNPSGLTTVLADYVCPATLGGSGTPRLETAIVEIVELTEKPCTPFETQRQLIFGFDILFTVVGLAATFVHRPGWRREASLATA